MERAATVSGTQSVGLKKGEMVVMDKARMTEKLRDLQNSVYSLEDRVYGTRKLGSLGLYGELKACRRKLASRQYGGTGTMIWTEPLDRVTDKEEEVKVGLDEKQNLVGVSEEYLKDRLQRFQGYKMILQKRADEFHDKIEACKTEVAGKELDGNEPSKVMIQEASKAGEDKAAVNQFLCGYVRTGASLQNLMLNVFAKGWLALSDFKLDQNLISVSLKDVKGTPKENALLFNGWKLAFDRGPVTVGELLNEGKDAQLVSWTYERKSEVAESGRCLPADDGVWNPR
ncbi:MAG: hypothetical protein HC902_11980 [Calothrix sp. SM1_5_4]|nr:hypothetical protein [Calothrix sp. SM1_5_4]